MYQMQQSFGAPVLDSRQAGRFNQTVAAVKRIFSEKATDDNDLHKSTTSTGTADTLSPKNINADTDDGNPLTPKNLLESLKRFLSGSYQVYLVFAVMGIIIVIRRKQWSRYHSLAVSLVAYNLIIFVPIAIASRYYTINVILFMPFTILSLSVIYQQCKHRDAKRMFFALVAIAILVQIRKGTDHAWKAKYRSNEYKIVGEWINANRKQFIKDKPVILSGDLKSNNLYQPGTDLIIASRKVQTAYWANADHIGLNDLVFDQQIFLKYMKYNKVDVIAAEGAFTQFCSDANLNKVTTSVKTNYNLFTLTRK